MKITFLKKSDAEWFDKFSRKVVSGTKYAYKIVDDSNTEWLLNATEEKDQKFCVITIETGQNTSLLDEQLKRKSAVFSESDIKPNMLYHIVSIPYLSEKQLKRKMYDSFDQLPEYLRSFDLAKYEKVTEKQKFKGKIVVMVNKDDIEEMVHFFYYEKIYPLINKNEQS